MNELRAVWKNVFFCKRVLACVIARIWTSPEAFMDAYKAFGRAGDEEMVRELIDPKQATRGSRTA